MGLVWFSPMNLPFGEFNWEEPLLNLNHISVEGLGVRGSALVLPFRWGSLSYFFKVRQALATVVQLTPQAHS